MDWHCPGFVGNIGLSSFTGAIGCTYLHRVRICRGISTVTSQKAGLQLRKGDAWACEITPDRIRRCPRVEIEIPKSLHAIEPLAMIDHSMLDMSSLKGKVVLALNIASEDVAAESNMLGLNDLYNKYHQSGFEIIAFPSNWFGQKEPGSDEVVAERLKEMFNPKFIIMSKLLNFDVEANPVFELGRHSYPGEVVWNFYGKFLFDKSGKPVGRFDLLTPYEFIDEQIQKHM